MEVIAYRYLGADSSNGEEFNRVHVEDYLPTEPFDVDRYNKLKQTVSYTELTHLSDALRRLQADPRFSVMLATAWVQPLLDKSEAIDVPLGGDQGYNQGYGPGSDAQNTEGGGQGNEGVNQGNDQGAGQSLDQGTGETGTQVQGNGGTGGQGGAPAGAPEGSGTMGQEGPQAAGPGMSGTMRVYGDHFLYVDLRLEATVPQGSDSESPGQASQGEEGTDEASQNEAGTDQASTGMAGGEAGTQNDLAVYHISEIRRIKLDEVQYFDHPYIGAIVSVTRYTGPPPGQATDQGTGQNAPGTGGAQGTEGTQGTSDQ